MKTKLLLLFLLPISVIAQSKYEKFLRKAEASYATGDYSKAASSLEKFRKKTTKKLGAQNKYTPIYNLTLGKYNLASGLVMEFESNLQIALSSNTLVQGNTASGVNIIIDAAVLHCQNGSYRKARELLEEAKSVMETSNLAKDPLKAKWDVAYAEALSGQGFYRQSIEILTDRAAYFAGRALKQETVVDDKGNLKSRKLTDEEFKQRVSENARLLTLLAVTYDRQGDLDKADSTFVTTSNWIRKALDRYSIEYLTNQYYFANYLAANLDNPLEGLNNNDADYSDLLNKLKANYKPTHFLATAIYESYLRLLLLEESNKYYNVKLEYEKLVNKEFRSTSIYRARLKALEFDSKLTHDKTQGLENAANNVLSNSQGLPRNNIVTANLNEFLATLSIAERKYASAEVYKQAVVDIKTDLFGERAPETHLARIQLANYFLDYTNKLSEAEKIYNESYKNIVEPEIKSKHNDLLDILNHLASMYELTDKYAESSATLQKALLAARTKFKNTDVLYGIELNNIARLEIKLGEYEKAEEHITESLKILEEFRKDQTKVVNLINAIETEATLYGIKGMFDDAEDNLDRSAKLISKQDRLVGIDELSTAKELSSLFIQLGRYAETEVLLADMLKEYEKQYGKTSMRLIDPLVNLGRLTLLKGDYTEADKLAHRANDIATKIYGEVSTKTAPTQKLISDIDYQIGDYENAETNIQKALKSQERQFGRNHIEVAKSLAQLALIKFYKGDKKKDVEKIMVEARDIIGARLGKDNPQYAEMLKNVAIIYISEKQYDVAFSSLTQAEAIWKAKAGRKRNINTASIYALTGDVYYQQKNYNKAEEFYTKAKDLYERFFSRNHPEYVRILSKMSKVYYMENDYKRAKRNVEEALTNYESFIKQFFPALSEREKAKYWNTIKGDFEFYNTLAFSQLEDFRDLSGKVYNYQLLTKALLLSSSIKVRERILNSSDESLKELYGSWVQKKEFLTNALSMSTQQLADNGINPEALTSEVENLERELSLKSELFGEGFETKKITYENVQKSLGKNEVAVEIVRYRHFNHTFTDSVIYVALYVKDDNARPKVIEMAEGHRMETRYFRYYRNCIIGKIPDAYSYKVFWEPIQKQIGQYATIYISPDGVYNQLNLEAIPTPDGKYVIDNSNIVMVSNTKDLYLKKLKASKGPKTASTSGTNSATMFGNPTFYLTASTGNISPLPGTEKEVKELDDLLKQKGWKTDEYLEGLATEEQVKGLESPKIFHIATHGFYTPETAAKTDESLTENDAQLSENPLLKTGLLLKGAGDVLAKTKYNYNMESGILTAYEAMNLNLDKTDLVVLSACETGLGDIQNGEGVYGLQRAFLVAGAKVLIMSMFKVDDEATQKLILNFYRKWLTTNNLRQSFVDAKKELRVDYPEPIYWGAFMMIGLD
jgi:CHAT domain-containing protein